MALTHRYSRPDQREDRVTEHRKEDQQDLCFAKSHGGPSSYFELRENSGVYWNDTRQLCSSTV